jgi:hypothetical protein
MKTNDPELVGVMFHTLAASPSGTHCTRGWVEEKRKFLTTQKLELRPLGRPASKDAKLLWTSGSGFPSNATPFE